MSAAPDVAPALPDPALQVERVSHRFGSRAALDEVSLAVPRGQFVALLGPNGAGKTTLFSVVTRLYANQHGTVAIFGHDLAREPSRALARLGVVFQARTLDTDLTVRQNLLYHAALHGIARRAAEARIAALLGRVGLLDRRDDKIRTLSGGQSRRIEIARALIHAPDLLLLDEPTVGLDLEARADIVRIYEGFLNGESGECEVSKIFDTADFGYREIRVERPLKLNFQATDERIARLADEKAFARLEDDEREEIEVVLLGMGDRLFTSRDAFEKALSKALKAESIKLGAQVKKAILAALSERDEEADICTDAQGNPEPDTELRDHELVPLKEDWRAYIAREVTPFVSDAWVDESYRDASDGKVGRVGYEINFNRYFYRYVPPRPLEDIDTELKALEAEIAGLLMEVAA